MNIDFDGLYAAVTDWMADEGYTYEECVTFPGWHWCAGQTAEKWVLDGDNNDGLYLFPSLRYDEYGYPYMDAESLIGDSLFRLTLYEDGNVRLDG